MTSQVLTRHSECGRSVWRRGKVGPRSGGTLGPVGSRRSVELLPEDGSARLRPGWLDPQAAEQLFDRVRSEAAWVQEEIRIAGRRSPVPRLTAWHGDPGVSYAYSGIRHQPHAWTPALLPLKALVEDEVGQTFNGALANYYRDGRDSVGWHADDEAELTGTSIASVSLGAPRRFSLRRADQHARRIEVTLEPGSLLVMDATCQRYWRHSVPKTTEKVGPRINLTFRWISTVTGRRPPSSPGSA